MSPDQVAELMRWMLREALILSAPIMLVASVSSLTLSLVQTLTSVQDQTLATVPRLLIVSILILAALPWFLHRLIWFTVTLFADFNRYLG
jgi:flagellar biosynthesis protein FliQ